MLIPNLNKCKLVSRFSNPKLDVNSIYTHNKSKIEIDINSYIFKYKIKSKHIIYMILVLLLTSMNLIKIPHK